MNQKLAKGKAWRRWSLFLLAASIFAPTASIGIMMYYYLKQEIESRRTIAFMNFEQQAYRIKDLLRDETRSSIDRVDGRWQLRFTREPRALLVQKNGQLQTVFGQLNPGELAPLSQSLEPSTDVATFNLAGQLLILTRIHLYHPTLFAEQEFKPDLYFALWNLDADFLPRNLPADTQRLYLINQQASLIYSSVAGDSETALLKQPLVQEFIKSPLARAGTALRTTKTGDQYGFYMSIPDSNLTLFVESSATAFFAPLIVPTSLALGILLGILSFIIVLWKNTVHSLAEQVQNLTLSLDEFSKGYLIPTQLSPQNYLIELRPLVESINKNTRGVRDRVDLMEKQKK